MNLNFAPFLAVIEGANLWPLGILAICIAFIILMIVFLRTHAFLALILTAILAGILSDPGMIAGKAGDSHWVTAVEQTMVEFGKTAGGVGVVIALASVIGMALLESGAADKIVRKFLSIFGEKRAGISLMGSGYFLSIPVFFDTVFFLLVPLARALRLRSGKDFMFYVMVISGAGVITHSLVAPTPGPLIMVENLSAAPWVDLKLGVAILGGFLMGLPPLVGVYFVAKWINKKVDVPLREVPGANMEDLNEIVNRKDDELPSFFMSVLPVACPIVLIVVASFLSMYEVQGGLADAMAFLGNKNIALFLGAAMSLYVLARQKKTNQEGLAALIAPALESAGLIILITSAGGAFGKMLVNAGVKDSIAGLAEGFQINYILLAWVIAVVMKIAQGSGTVSMITTSVMMAGVLTETGPLPYHPIYIFAAVGFGSLAISWMNDSGFWVVGRLSGFTEKETLKSWTVMLASVAVFGLIQTLILATILPMAPEAAAIVGAP